MYNVSFTNQTSAHSYAKHFTFNLSFSSVIFSYCSRSSDFQGKVDQFSLEECCRRLLYRYINLISWQRPGSQSYPLLLLYHFVLLLLVLAGGTVA